MKNVKQERLWAWMRADDARPNKAATLPWRMFWTGFAVRVLYILLVHTYHVRTDSDHLHFGWEAGRIARALITGYGYADPFSGHSGPTAWLSPAYPLLMAGVFRVFGLYSNTSALVLLVLNSLFSAAIAPAVYEIARRCYGGQQRGAQVALWSGWLWALYPAAMQYAVRWFWEMSLTVCAFSWILVIALRVRGTGEATAPAKTTALWCGFGVLWAVIALSNPSLLLLLPVLALWMLFNPVRFPLQLLRAMLAAMLFVACTAPWVYRNWVVFHAFIPTRGNLGAELYQSVLPSNDGFPWGATIPLATDAPEYQSYRRMGEAAYVRMQGEKAQAIIATDKTRIRGYVLKRIYFFWFGVPKPEDHGLANEAIRILSYSFISLAALFGLTLSLRQHIPASGLFAAMFLVMPLPYYMLTVQARFRHPLEPVMTILIVYLFQSASPRHKEELHPTTGASAR